jgi:hypothetical protein
VQEVSWLNCNLVKKVRGTQKKLNFVDQCFELLAAQQRLCSMESVNQLGRSKPGNTNTHLNNIHLITFCHLYDRYTFPQINQLIPANKFLYTVQVLMFSQQCNLEFWFSVMWLCVTVLVPYFSKECITLIFHGQLSIKTTDPCTGGVWGWQVGRPAQAPLLSGPCTSGLRLSTKRKKFYE